MKHIFKRLHHSNRSNESSAAAQQQSSTSSSSSSSAAATATAPAAPLVVSQSSVSSSSTSAAVSDNRTSSSSSSSSSANDPGVSPVVSSTSSNSVSSVATALPVSLPTRQQQQDYYASEEDFQVQLALALSVSSSSSAKESGNLLNSRGDHHQIQCRADSDAAADYQSRQYWDYGVIEYEERVTDGFYDMYSLSTDPSIRGRMPSLADIEANPSGSDFEVVIVNRKYDTALEELMQIALCCAEDCPLTEIGILVQRLAELVTDQMGGPVKDANVVLTRWMERSTELRTSLHTAVLPIGSLRIGLSRHRALLFKVLADVVKMPCRLVKGSHYTGIEDDAVNVIKLPNDSEFLVDLMAAPGTLIPADAQSGKESHPPTSGTLPNHQVSSALVAAGSKQNIPAGQYSEGESKFFLGRRSEMPDNSRNFAGASTSGFSEYNNRVQTANLAESSQALAIDSLHKGVCGPNIVEKGKRMNLNMVPYNDNNPDDLKNLFADLNPFQIKGSGKAYLNGNVTGKKVDGLHQPNKNLNTGLPPVPLMWKNSHANNEVPQTKKYDNKNHFPKSSHQVVDRWGPSNPSTSSSASEKASADIHKLPNKSRQSHEVTDNASALASAGTSLEQIPAGNGRIIDHKMEPLKDSGGLQCDVSKVSLEPGDKVNRWQDSRNIMEHALLHSSLISSDPASSSSSVNSEVHHVDAVIDDVSECEIPWEDLEIGERIGLGSYGEVYRADWNGTEVAVKKFLDQDFLGAALEEFRREVRIMQRLRHPNVVLFMGAVTRPPNLSIITEFLPRGSLYRIIHRPHCQIDEKQRIKMALDVAKGMNCLHTSIPTIVHRDLKSPNLLVDNNWNVKVCDFGLSRLKHNTFLSSKSTAGTPEWMAPEVLRNEPSNEKCDVYSFGIILWELATLKLPWSGMNPMQVVGAVGFQNRRLEIPKEVDPLVARIIWECWQTDPNLRPSFAQLTVALKPLQRLVVPSPVDLPR